MRMMIQFWDFFCFCSVLVQAIAILFSFRSEERCYNHFRFHYVLVHANNTALNLNPCMPSLNIF